MRRHGWAFGLGLLVSSAALAQPPADSERYPPAPDLPGVVVGQTKTGRPVGKVVAIGGQEEKQILAEPAPVPKALEKAPELAVPAKELATANPTPIDPAPVQASCPKPTQGHGLGTGKHLDCAHRLQQWLFFRSRARQSGHYVTPYYYPLQAWFPCEPRRPICGTCASAEGPRAGKHHHGIALPRYEANNPIPVVIPPTTEKIVPPDMPPVSPKLMPKSGVITPLPIPPAPTVEGDLPPGFQKVDVGLSFTPGVAPISKPTTQTDKVSNWRPK